MLMVPRMQRMTEGRIGLLNNNSAVLYVAQHFGEKGQREPERKVAGSVQVSRRNPIWT